MHRFIDSFQSNQVDGIKLLNLDSEQLKVCQFDLVFQLVMIESFEFFFEV